MDMSRLSGFLHVLVAQLIILQICHHTKPPCSSAAATPTLTCSNKTYVNYIKTSCNVTTYPKLCYKSLSVFASKIKTDPKVLAHTALKVSFVATKRTSVVLNRLNKTQGLKPMESVALCDCIELVDDSSYELKSSMTELRRLRSENFAFGISNILTWASAALTNSVTCMDGFEETNGMILDKDYVKETVFRHAKKVCRLTSNALALVNSYASGHV